MTGFEWLGSLTSLIELITSLIPRRVQIAPTHRGIKFVGMRKIVVCREGNYWVWPVRSEMKVHLISARPIALAKQYVMSSEGTQYLVDGSILVSIVDSEEGIINAFVRNDEIEEICASEASNAICDLMNDSLDDELCDRDEFNVKLTRMTRRRLRKYGIRTHRAYVSSLASGRPILMLGSGIV